MAESRALSQWEIDALLNQIPDGGDQEETVASAPGAPQSGPANQERQFARLIKPYDFRRPDKFSKEQWHTLQSMHDTFARVAGAALSSRLRTLVSVRLSSIDQGLYEEWQSQVPSQTICYVLSMAPLDGNIVLEFNREVAAEFIDRLLGGSGLLIDANREVGEIEVTLLRALAGGLVKSLEEMWAAVLPTQFELKDIGLDAGLIQIAGANDVVVTAFFEVSIGNQLGAMSICLPYTLVEPIVSMLSTRNWNTSSPKRQPEQRAHRVMRVLLGRAPLDVVACLGGADVPLRAVTEMQLGDTIVLDRRIDEPIEVYVGDRPRFHARPGLSGNQVGALVLDVVEEPAYDLDEADLREAGIGGSRLTMLDRSTAQPAASTAAAAPIPITPDPVNAGFQEAANG